MLRGAILAGVLAGGCASWQPPAVAPYYAGDLGSAERIFRARAEAPDNDWALMANELATCLDAEGRDGEALRLYYDAGRAMAVWDTSFSESFGAMAGREDSKEYKGDPYEQALNSIFTGLLFWQRGEADNARACFKEAMLRDADSADDRFQSDLALSFYLAAWASRDMGLPGDAADFLDEARAARRAAVESGARGSAAPRCFDDFAGANVLLVASIGRGPEKVAAGAHGELAVIEANPSPVEAAVLTAGGRPLGRTEVLADVYFQAATRGGRWMDGLRKGKAVFKDLAAVTGVLLAEHGLSSRDASERGGYLLAGLGALLVSAAVSAEADLRCWRTLPDTVQVLARRLAPGRRVLAVDFVGPGGAVLPGFRREIEVEVPAKGTLVLHLPSLPWPPKSGPDESRALRPSPAFPETS